MEIEKNPSLQVIRGERKVIKQIKCVVWPEKNIVHKWSKAMAR